ncbi:CAP domain-containing protein [Akkermansiaceae bacterium]|nr:CAP domain-containing protein [Akkermansiaceae bacterium]
MRLPALLCSALFAGLLPAQETDPAIPPMAVRKALQWMQDQNAEKREAAYRTFQLYGESAKEVYTATLEKARTSHEKRLTRLLNDKSENPYHGTDLLTEELKAERERIYPLIRTDYKKDSAKIKMLRGEIESLTNLNAKLRKLSHADSSKFDTAVSSISTALAEVRRELILAEGEELEDQELDHLAALQDSFDGEVYLKTKSQIASIQKEVAALKEATDANAACAWANSSQKDFTKLLNDNRSLFGITPLRMEERLSAAATGHSNDMATIGFFSHTSPVKGKKSPGDRARAADYKYRWSGENIFMGSTSHASAYNAWFGSDGHRFIMFSDGPNLIGIGPHGKHWTMMTGKK